MRKKYRYGHNEMKASVSVLFRLFYVVLFRNKRNVILLKKSVGKNVNIIDK